MGLILMEGFDAYGTTNGATATGLDRNWVLNSTNTFGVSSGRTGGKSLNFFNSNRTMTKIIDATDTLLIGFALRPVDSLVAFTCVRVMEGSNVGINLRISNEGRFQIWMNNTQLAETTTTVATLGNWSVVELLVVVGNSGSYELRINGVTELSASVDTQPASNAWADGIQFVSNVGGNGRDIDDLYARDDSTFLGSWKIQTIFPDGDGAVDCTPSTGSDNFGAVDDNPADGDSTYVTGDAGDVDLYDHASLTNVSQVYALQVNTVCRQTDATPRSVKIIAKSGSTTDASASKLVGSTDYVHRSEIWTDNPDTAAPWTASEIAAAQFGFEVE